MNTQPVILLIIDPQVPDYQHLAAGIIPGVELLILEEDRDGVEQITEYLTGESVVRGGSVGSVGSVGSNLPPSPPTPPPLPPLPLPPSLHLISHGSPGTIYLGNSTLELNNLEKYRPQLEKWGITHLYIYGCSVAAGDAGAEFLTKLHQITQAQIYANPHPTGNAALGGTWHLQPIQSPRPEVSPSPRPPVPLSLTTQQTYQGILSGDLVWAKGMGGSGTDSGYSIAVDSSGNTYTTGYFSGTVDFDPGAGTANLTSAGSNDIFITKIDANGNYVWAKGIGGSNSDYSQSITVDSSGNTYITGYFSGTADFDPGAGTANLTSASGSQDIFITKLDANGNYLWARNFGDIGNIDSGKSIAVDSSGNTYITGSFLGTADFDPGAGTANLTSVSGVDIFITKLDTNGNYLWAKGIGGSGAEEGNSIAVDSSGNTYTTGYFSATVDFDPSGAGIANLTAGAGNTDTFIVKLDANGNHHWSRQIGGGTMAMSNSIAVDSSGNTYTTGYFEGTVDFDPTAGIVYLTSPNNYRDIFITKLNADGTFAWAKQIGNSAAHDSGTSIALDSSGNTYTTGSFVGTVDFDPGAGTANLTSATSNYYDLFISKLDANGNYVWAKNIGGSTFDQGQSIAVDSSGNIYTTGYFEGTADFDPGAGTTNLTSAGSSDIFIVKLSESPTVSSITSTTTNGTYGIGTVIPITVTFSEPVNVTGTPTLTLNTGANATYASGSGTNTLTFNYTVAAGNNTADLDYSSTTALALNGGTIRNTGNTTDATLTLPTPGAANSLGANKSLIIDGITPTVTIEQAGGQTDPATTSPINFTVTFSESVTGFNAADISFTGSTAGGTLTPTITGSGTAYNVAVSGMTTSGTVIPSVIANAATDTAGNTSAASTSTDNTVTYNTIPTVSNISKTGNEDNNIPFAAADFTAVFSDVDNDTLNKIQITTLPANGTLQLSGSNVALNQEILLANIPNLTFTPTADYNGSSSFTWNGSDGSNYATSNATANLTINPVNDQPGFTATTPATVNEDAGAITLTNWATFNPGPSDEASQTATYTVSNISNPGLFAAIPTVNSSGTLTYTPATDANGTSTFDVVVQDNGGTTNGGVNTSTVQTFTITVDSVNDAPSFTTTGNPPTVNEDAAAITITNWATFNPGPANEASQTATYTISSISNPGLFATAPTVNSSGTLTYTPATNANGTSTFDVVVQDSGGTANGGVDTSTVQTFTITVDSVNDAPSFTNAGNQTLTAWTDTAQTVSGWANTFVFGPTDENTQTVSDFLVNITSGTDLFTTLPDIANDGTLTYTPSGKPGIATISVQLKDDGGVVNGGNDTSAPITFDITIPPPTVELSVDTITATEAGTTAITLTATAAGAVFGNQTLNLALTGTASNADFSGTIPAQITIADGSNSGQVTLNIANDFIDEDSETATFTISNPSIGIQLGTTTAQTITITDDDTAGYDITTISGDTSEFASLATFDISLTSQPTATVTLNFTSSDTTEGTVIPSVTFDATNWNVGQTITITGVDDAVADSNISYNITSTATSTDPKYNNNNPTNVAVINTDNDIPGVTVIQTGGNTELTEDSVTDSYTIQLNTLPSSNVNVTATADAQTEISLDGVNFAATQTLTFTNVNGMTPQTVTVRAINDTTPEDYHSGGITHTISNSADVNYPTTMTVGDVNPNITDNDISYTLTTNSSTINEGNSGTQQITYNITRAGAINETSSADFSFSGTAANTIDYNLVSITGTGITTSGSTITFAPNSTSATMTVEIVGDRIDEENETLEINLVNPTATGTANVIGSPATTTITDDDTAGTTVTPNAGLTTTEAGGNATFTVELTSQPTANVTINLSSDKPAEGTINKPGLTFTAANWNTPQTVTVTGVDDLVDDGDIAYNIITAAATSTDAKYNGMNADDVAVTNSDNDTAGITVTPTSGLATTETGGKATFTVVLTSQPTANVAINLSSDNIAEGTIDKNSLTFTAANWNSPQTVTVTGVDDLIADGNIPYNIITAATSTDAKYNGMDAADVALSNSDNDSGGITVTPINGLTTTEAGGTATFTVTLNTQPTANVTINLTSDNAAEGRIDKTSLIFTPSNWNAAQTITVMGVDDLVDDGNIAYNIITAPAISTDASYNGVDAADVAVSNSDNELPVDNNPTPSQPPGVIFSSSSLSVYEGGNTGYTIALTSAPTAPVTINFTTDSQVIALPPVTFDIYNWNHPQTVTVTAVDNAVAAVNPPSIIAHNITSADVSYNQINVGTVAANITDNDTAGLIVMLPVGSGDVIEGGGEDIYKLMLTQPPTADVVVSISGDSQLMVNTPSLTLTPSNWNQAQVWRVAAVDDAILEGEHQGNISFALTSDDGTYNQVAVAPLSVNIADNDNVGMETSLSAPSGVAGTDADDKIVGSGGADLVYGRGGTNYIDAGGGDDILYGGNGADDITGGAGLDQILASEGEDYLAGGDGDDVLFAGNGNDRMFGGGGNDLLSGDEGNDYLFGDGGVDSLTGGLGRDAFAIGNGSGGMTVEMADVITDFVSGEDVMDLMAPLGFGDLSLVQNGADVVMQNRVSGEFLALLQGVDVASLSAVDFL